MLGVPGSFHGDLGCRGVDFPEVGGRQLDLGRPGVFLQAMRLGGAPDGDDPGLLGEQPGEGELGGGRVLPLGNLAEQVDEGLVCLAGLGREAGDDVAEVGAVEPGVLVDLAGQKTLPEWVVGYEADAKLLERRERVFLGLPPLQRVLALERGDRLDGVGPSRRRLMPHQDRLPRRRRAAPNLAGDHPLLMAWLGSETVGGLDRLRYRTKVRRTRFARGSKPHDSADARAPGTHGHDPATIHARLSSSRRSWRIARPQSFRAASAVSPIRSPIS